MKIHSHQNVPDGDVVLFGEIVDDAIAKLTTAFGTVGGASLVDDLTLFTRLHRGDGNSSRTLTWEITENGKRRAYALLEMLTLSSQSGRTNLEEPKDLNYFHKTTVHELSMLCLIRFGGRFSYAA